MKNCSYGSTSECPTTVRVVLCEGQHQELEQNPGFLCGWQKSKHITSCLVGWAESPASPMWGMPGASRGALWGSLCFHDEQGQGQLCFSPSRAGVSGTEATTRRQCWGASLAPHDSGEVHREPGFPVAPTSGRTESVTASLLGHVIKESPWPFAAVD